MFKKDTQNKPPQRTRPTSGRREPNKVFSYHSGRRPVDEVISETQSARKNRDSTTAKKRVGIFAKRFGVVLISLGILGILLWNARIIPSDTTIVLQGTPEQRLLLQEPSVYKAGAEEMFQESITHRSKLTLSTKDFNKEMAQRFPEIKSARISLPLFGGASTVYIEPSPAAIVFTGTNNQAFVIDAGGRVISANTTGAPQGLPVVADQSGIIPQVGKQILPSSDILAMQTIILQLKEKGITVESMVLPSAAQRLEVRVQGKPYFIKFSLHDDIKQQVGAYIAVSNKFGREGTNPGEYVDVRVADRVYYK